MTWPPGDGTPAEPLPEGVREGDAAEVDPRMPEAHTGTLWIPPALEGAGLPVFSLDGWETNQARYYWTKPVPNGNDVHFGYDGIPSGAMWHHTATAAYTPFVRNAQGRTISNMFAGLWRGAENRRLYQEPPGDPLIVIASAGPANFSSGLGWYPFLTDWLIDDRRFPGPQTEPDGSIAANRYVWNTEIVHRGDGTELHPDVWDILVTAARVLSDGFRWSPWRHHAHEDWTTRKIDPRFTQGAPYTIAAFQDAVLEEEDMWPVLGDQDDSSVRRFTVEAWQLKLAALEGHPYSSGSTNTVIAAAGMNRGTYDDAMAALVAAHTDTGGGGIGPREGAQIDKAFDALHDHGDPLEGYQDLATTLLVREQGT